MCNFDAIYFPMYQPRTSKQSETNIKLNSDKATKQALERESEINTDMAQLVKMKVRAAYRENKNKMRIHPANSPFPGIFGLNVLEEDDKIIVITEGEYDAMAVH
jgi:twinkle protein